MAYQLITHAITPLVLAQWLLLLVVPLLLLLNYAYASRRSRSGHGSSCSDDDKHQQLPPSPPGLPIIGHLHLVGDLPHVSLRDLSAKHGRDGLMLLRLGTVPSLVVSSPRAAEAIMRTHDQVFASRPSSTVSDDLLYGSSDITFSPYGEHWRQIRKLVTTHLLTVEKVHSYCHVRKEEVRFVLAKVREAAAAGTAVDMSMTMNTFANDIISHAVSGKFFRAEGRNKLFRELVEANSALFGGFNLEDYFPELARSPLGFLGRRFLRKRVHETHKRWDELLETILSDHERRDSSMHRHDHDGGGDFTDVLLSVQKEYGMTRDHIKAILIDLFAAGTDTSSLVLELAMAELMRNPQKLAKLQGEVRKHTSPEGLETVEEEDLASMPYLRAVMKETLRLHPPAPLLAPHLSMADCVVIDGYYVPAGTRVIVNAWALGRDPASWEKPEEFMPERFMDDGSAAAAGVVDFKGNHFQFLPFGAGRRICPGINFGMATVEIMLANLMYCFDWQLPLGMEEKDVDMTEVFGVTVRRKEKLMLVPRLPAGAPAARRHSALLHASC